MWDVLLTAITSWGAVYTLCAAPAVFMMGSFVVGDCFVAEALDAVSGRRADRKGRLCVLSSYSLLALQLFLYPLQVRDTCSPSSLAECDKYDAIFWASWLGTLGLYTWCLLGSTHRKGVDAMSKGCRRCGIVEGRDHHCIIINSCVGRRNYAAFIGLLACALVSAINILVSTIDWVSLWGTPIHHLAYVASAVYAAGATLLLLFQAYLTVRGVTTIDYLRRK